MTILSFPFWRAWNKNVSKSPPEQWKPSPNVIIGYANDIVKHGKPLDSGLPDYFRKCADYYEKEAPHDQH